VPYFFGATQYIELRASSHCAAACSHI